MGYIEDNLAAGEKIVYRAYISPAILIFQTVLCAIFVWIGSNISTFAIFLFGLIATIAIIRTFFALLTTEFAITDKRIIAKRGVLKQHSLEIQLNQVESIGATHSLPGRIFKYGTIIITGSGGTRETFPFIGNPNDLRKRVNAQISKIIG